MRSLFAIFYPRISKLRAQPIINFAFLISKIRTSHSALNQLQYSRGSVILPVIALAATVAGDARNTCDSLCPMRPGKFRFVALMHFIGEFIRPNVSTGPPKQAAQPAFSVICTPESSRICQTDLSPHLADC